MKKWRPQLGDRYWVITFAMDMAIDWAYCEPGYIFDKYFKMGNVFRTRREALQAASKIKSVLKRGGR